MSLPIVCYVIKSPKPGMGESKASIDSNIDVDHLCFWIDVPMAPSMNMIRSCISCCS